MPDITYFPLASHMSIKCSPQVKCDRVWSTSHFLPHVLIPPPVRKKKNFNGPAREDSPRSPCRKEICMSLRSHYVNVAFSSPTPPPPPPPPPVPAVLSPCL
uniref:Uncharacterized protein n=1 Tax=Coccidioides posadasii RMSCC 3488 TaxID=454284 RepID=A0A0J6F7R5_COCPO|nr:hypothetical protein CPAG_05354 [Coccidioides posadasii RMSCC 3488]